MTSVTGSTVSAAVPGRPIGGSRAKSHPPVMGHREPSMTGTRHLETVDREEPTVLVTERCTELISNEGTELLVAHREEYCGLRAEGYCHSCGRFVCSMHKQTRHSVHTFQRRP